MMKNKLLAIRKNKRLESLSNYQLIKIIYNFLNKNKKLWFLKTLLIMLLTSVSEFFTIALITPLLFTLSNPNSNINDPTINSLINFFKVTSQKEITLLLAFLFLFVAVISSIIKIINLRNYLYFCQSVGIDLSSTAFANLLHQDYKYHINQNSSEPIAAISNFTNNTVQYLQGMLQILTGIMASLGTIFALLWVNFQFTLITILTFIFIYLFLISYTKKRIFILSKKIAFTTTSQIKIIQESISSIRDIIIGKHHAHFIDLYKAREIEKRLATSQGTFIGAAPKFVVEALGLILIISITLFAYNLNNENGSAIGETLPFVGAVALGCQRLLPFLQLTYSSLSTLRSEKESVIELIKIVNLGNNYFLKKGKKPHIKLTNDIVFKNIHFSYEDNLPVIIRDFNFRIKKGENIAIIGKTGSGKSTLLDIILGLLTPTKGGIFVNGTLIDSSKFKDVILDVSNVPQVINLSDATIKQNIAYGVPENKIDFDLVQKCARLALIEEFINSLDKKYEHIIGEKGIKISGGQRQRIGIARALYNQAEILVLDEATSALDKKTETAVLESIKSHYKKLTLIMVTHNLPSIKFFDKVIELKDGKINT